MAGSASFDYLIVGGGIAGVTAAQTIRSRDRNGTILIVSQERESLYSRVLLPSYVRGSISREQVYLRGFDDYTKNDIDLALGQEVIGINFDTREAITSEEKKISFRKMLAATGGEPAQWQVPGGESPRVLRLQTLADADHAREYITSGATEAIIVGDGFIALEFVGLAAAFGSSSHLFLRGKKMFGDLYDKEGAKILQHHLERSGATVYPETTISRLEENGGVLTAYAGRDTEVKGAWCGVGAGIKRNLGVFVGSGIDIKKGIRTNSFLEASLPNIWAAGDIAEYFDIISGEYRMVGNWTNAFLQGKVAGINMSASDPSARAEFRAVPSYSIASLGFHITHIGKTEDIAGMQDVVRIWPGGGAYERLFLENGILKCAVLVNRFQDKVAVARLIEQKTNISGKINEIKNVNFDVSSLLS